jgi:hypothetical protein
MRPVIFAVVTSLSIAGPISSAYAQAPENSPSTSMDKSGSPTGRDLKATGAAPHTKGSKEVSGVKEMNSESSEMGRSTSGSAAGSTGGSSQ